MAEFKQKYFHLGQDQLDCQTVVRLSNWPKPYLQINDDVRARIARFRAAVNKALSSGKIYYGINTGFGYLSNVKIEPDKLEDLQLNLLRSHACGVGQPLDIEMARALLLLRLHSFSLGYSGASLELVDRLHQFMAYDIIPVVPRQGSVGASGDLAPLAHLALPLIGEGEVFFEGERVAAAVALKKHKLNPLKIKPKEGLSLINGTHLMQMLSAFGVTRARNLARHADLSMSLSLDALRGTLRAFDERIHLVRPHRGQQEVALNIAALFAERDPVQESHKDCGRVQDPYSFRCSPQVHGAARDAIRHVGALTDVELNSITDNPLIFEDGDLVSGGNFHGEPLALGMDYLAIALCELGSIAEQRIHRLINPQSSELPAFLVQESGLNSGYMIPHVVAASLVAENRVLAHPASVDSIPTSADKEDHVSMGSVAGLKLQTIIENVEKILAIEYMCACQALELLEPLKPNRHLSSVKDQVRTVVPFVERDLSLSNAIAKMARMIREETLLQTLHSQGIELV